MPVVCINRPNRSRPRLANASDAARFVCAAIANGATQEDIEDELDFRGCWKRREQTESECQRERARLQRQMLELIDGNQQVYAIARGSLTFILAQIIALLGLAKLIPLLGKPIEIAASQARLRVVQLVTVVEARAAANQAVYNALRAAA